MIPQKSLSNPTLQDSYIPPDNQSPYSAMVSLQLGGIGISDPSQGLEYQTWTLALSGNPTANEFWLSAPNTPATLIYQLPSGQSANMCSLAFDQNMKYAIGYTTDSGGFLYWYNATIPGYQLLFLGASIISVQLTMDDKRSAQTRAGTNDIICAFTDTKNLYYSQLRDRFTIQYTLSSNIPLINPKLFKVGMNEKWRLQFFLEGDLYQ
jgi:hypothetical protein